VTGTARTRKARERWRRIPGLPGYQVSDRGRARSVDRVVNGRAIGGVMLTQHRDRDGYWRVKAGGKWLPVHQLVMLAFTGRCPAGQEVRHLRGQDDNSWEALCYGTHAENEADKKRVKQIMDIE